MMLRIAAVLPDLGVGGAQRVALSLLRELHPERVTVYLLLLDARGTLEGALGDYPVEDLKAPRLRHGLSKLLRRLRQIGPEVTFSTIGYVNIALAALRPVLPGKLVLREANMPSLSLSSGGLPGAMRLAYRLLYPRADAILASSVQMQSELAAMGVPRAKLHVMRNPVDVAGLRRQAEHPRRIEGDGVRLVAAGRLVPQKGFDRLIPLLSELPEVRLAIFGAGPMRQELEQLTVRHRANVDFMGAVNDTAAWFAGADALLLPSRWEGMPNVALEALACGTPVIATPESGGIAELAAAASPGAVRIADIGGGGFRTAVEELTARPDRGLRASLLPPEYDSRLVAQHFARILAEISGRH